MKEKVSDNIFLVCSSGGCSCCFDGNRFGSWYSRLNNIDNSFRTSWRYVLKKTRGKYH